MNAGFDKEEKSRFWLRAGSRKKGWKCYKVDQILTRNPVRTNKKPGLCLDGGCWNERRLTGARQGVWRSGVLRWSVEHHTGLSSRWVEDPVVRARFGSQVRLVVLLWCVIRRWGGSRLRLWRGWGSCRLFFSWWRSLGRSFLLHHRLEDLWFWSLKMKKQVIKTGSADGQKMLDTLRKSCIC